MKQCYNNEGNTNDIFLTTTIMQSQCTGNVQIRKHMMHANVFFVHRLGMQSTSLKIRRDPSHFCRLRIQVASAFEHVTKFAKAVNFESK